MCYLCFKSWYRFSFFCKWTSDVCSLSGAHVTTAPHVADSSFKIYDTKTLKLYGSLLKTVSHSPIQRRWILLTKSFLMSHLALKWTVPSNVFSLTFDFLCEQFMVDKVSSQVHSEAYGKKTDDTILLLIQNYLHTVTWEKYEKIWLHASA